MNLSLSSKSSTAPPQTGESRSVILASGLPSNYARSREKSHFPKFFKDYKRTLYSDVFLEPWPDETWWDFVYREYDAIDRDFPKPQLNSDYFYAPFELIEDLNKITLGPFCLAQIPLMYGFHDFVYQHLYDFDEFAQWWDVDMKEVPDVFYSRIRNKILLVDSDGHELEDDRFYAYKDPYVFQEYVDGIPTLNKELLYDWLHAAHKSVDFQFLQSPLTTYLPEQIDNLCRVEFADGTSILTNGEGAPLLDIPMLAWPVVPQFKTKFIFQGGVSNATVMTRSKLSKWYEPEYAKEFLYWLRNFSHLEHEKSRFISANKLEPWVFYREYCKYPMTPSDQYKFAKLYTAICSKTQRKNAQKCMQVEAHNERYKLELQGGTFDTFQSAKTTFSFAAAALQQAQNFIKQIKEAIKNFYPSFHKSLVKVLRVIKSLAHMAYNYSFVPECDRSSFLKGSIGFLLLDLGVEMYDIGINTLSTIQGFTLQSADNVSGLFSSLIAFVKTTLGFKAMDSNELRNLQMTLACMSSLQRLVPISVDYICRLVNFAIGREPPDVDAEVEFVKQTVRDHADKPGSLTEVHQAKAASLYRKHYVKLCKDELIAPKMTEIETMLLQRSTVSVPPKVNPVTICCSGKAGIGKSELLNPLMTLVYKALNEDFELHTHMFQKSTSSEYWDGYDKRHKVFWYDDFGLLTDSTSVTESLNDVIRVSSGASAPLNMAELSGKGVSYFNSEIIYLTTNLTLDTNGFKPGKALADSVAFFRRIDYSVSILGRGKGSNYSLEWCDEPPYFDRQKNNYVWSNKRRTGTIVDLAISIAKKLRTRREQFIAPPSMSNIDSLMGELQKKMRTDVQLAKYVEDNNENQTESTEEARSVESLMEMDPKNVMPSLTDVITESVKIENTFETEGFQFFKKWTNDVADKVQLPSVISQHKWKLIAGAIGGVTALLVGMAYKYFKKETKCEEKQIGDSWTASFRPQANFFKDDLGPAEIDGSGSSKIEPASLFSVEEEELLFDDLTREHRRNANKLVARFNDVREARTDYINALVKLGSGESVPKAPSTERVDPKEFDNLNDIMEFCLFAEYHHLTSVEIDDCNKVLNVLWDFSFMKYKVWGGGLADHHMCTKCNQLVLKRFVSGKCLACLGYDPPSWYFAKDVPYKNNVDVKLQVLDKFVAESAATGTAKKLTVRLESAAASTPRKMHVTIQGGVPTTSLEQNIDEVLKTYKDNGAGIFAKLHEQDANALLAHQIVVSNQLTVANDAGVSLQGLAVCGRLVVAPRHLFPPDMKETTLYINSRNITDIRLTVTTDDVYYLPDSDVMFFYLPRNVPEFKNISHHFQDGLDSSYTNGFVSTVTFDQRGTLCLLKSCSDLRPHHSSVTAECVNGTLKSRYTVSRPWRYTGHSVRGDCGSPIYVCSKRAPRKILGIHIGRITGAEGIGEGIFCVVGREDIEAAKRELCKYEVQGGGDGKVVQHVKDNVPCMVTWDRDGAYRHFGIVADIGRGNEVFHLTSEGVSTSWCQRFMLPEKARAEFYSKMTDEELETFKRRIVAWNVDGEPTELRHEWSVWNGCDNWCYDIIGRPQPLLNEFVRTIMLLPVKAARKVFLEGGVVGEFYYQDNPDFPNFNWVAETNAVAGYGTNHIVKSNLHGVVPVTSYPSIMKPITVDGERIDPLKQDLLKGCKPKPVIHSKMIKPAIQNFNAVFKKAMALNYKKCELYMPRILTDVEMINGIRDAEGVISDCFLPLNLSTSSGLPDCATACSGKRHMFNRVGDKWELVPEYEKRLKQAEEQLLRGEKPDWLFLPSLKAELRSAEKVASGQTRVFVVCPVDMNMLIRKYFGCWVAIMMALHNDFEVCVGINVHGADAEVLGDVLKISDSNSRYDAGDYKGWDKNMHFEMGMWLYDVVQDFYNDDFGILRRTLLEMTFAGNHVIGEHVYQIPGVMPSGTALTAVGNSVINSVLTRIGVFECMDAYEIDWRQAAEAYVQGSAVIKTYGDDKVHLVPDWMVPFFTMRWYRDWLAQFSIIYTPPDKTGDMPDHLTPQNLTFLKRRFEFDINGRLRMPLPLTVIFDIVNWQRKGLPYREANQSNFDSFSIELTHFPREIYEFYTLKVVSYALLFGQDLHPADYDLLKTKIAKTATTLGYTNQYSKLLSLMRMIVKTRTRVIYSKVTKRIGMPFFRWCTELDSSKDYLCRKCSRDAIYLDQGEVPLCLRCVGVADVPDWYYHSIFECGKCRENPNNPFFKLSLILHDRGPNQKQRENEWLSDTLTGKSIGPVSCEMLPVEVQLPDRFLNRGHFCSIDSTSIPWYNDYVEFATPHRLGRVLKLNNCFNFRINLPFLPSVYDELAKQLQELPYYDFVIVGPVASGRPTFYLWYSQPHHGSVQRLAVEYVSIYFKDEWYSTTSVYVLNLVKDDPTKPVEVAK